MTTFDNHLFTLKAMTSNWLEIGLCFFLSLLTLAVGVTIYNLLFHPLAGFPCPKIAAATGWYEFWYDVIKRGQYVYVIEQMHKEFGPIVRLSPNERSIHDPDFYNEVYVAGNTRRTNIWPKYRKGIGFDRSHTMSELHELHRARRKPLEPFFSRQGIERIEPAIVEEAKLLDARFEALAGSGAVIRLDHVFSAFAGDVIAKVCCETPTSFMKHPEFSPDWHNQIESVVSQILLFMHVPFLVSLVRLMPLEFLLRAYQGGGGFNSYRKIATDHIIQARQEKRNNVKVIETPKSSIFRYILCSDIPEEEQSVERLSREAMVLLGAGTATTARTMGFICFYALANFHIEAKLRGDLADVMSNYPETLPKWSELEKAPYLKACIKEGLRLSYGVMRRLPRCSPDVALQYKQWTIPNGTPVGMGAYLMHTDPEVFPQPFEFVPERWLGEYDPRMERNWVPFTKGSRYCLGINLAYAEMNVALATLFRPGGPEMKLFETDEDDVKQVVDFLMPIPKLDSRGTRITIEKVEQYSDNSQP